MADAPLLESPSGIRITMVRSSHNPTLSSQGFGQISALYGTVRESMRKNKQGMATGKQFSILAHLRTQIRDVPLCAT